MFIQIHPTVNDARQIILHIHVDSVLQRNNLQFLGVFVVCSVYCIVQFQKLFRFLKNHSEQSILVLTLHCKGFLCKFFVFIHLSSFAGVSENPLLLH